MKRRQFLRNGLLFGTAGLSSGTGLASGLLADSKPSAEPALLYFDASYAHDLLTSTIENGKTGVFIEVFKSLIKQGIDVNATDEFGATFLHHAAQQEKENDEVFKLLVSNGAVINVKSNDDNTPLHHAVFRNKNLDIISFLVSNGAIVNAKGRDGQTPLHVATWNVDVEVAEFLVSKGADVHSKDNDGRTPLHELAKWHDNVGIAELLVSNGADVYAKDNDGKTALDWANENYHESVVEYLSSVTRRKPKRI